MVSHVSLSFPVFPFQTSRPELTCPAVLAASRPQGKVRLRRARLRVQILFSFRWGGVGRNDGAQGVRMTRLEREQGGGAGEALMRDGI